MSDRAWEIFAALVFTVNFAMAFSDAPSAPVNAAVAGLMLWVRLS
jgi:uncharacterized membrane protein YjjB (DUF3815 family)